jgi:hypothetical protein
MLSRRQWWIVHNGVVLHETALEISSFAVGSHYKLGDDHDFIVKSLFRWNTSVHLSSIFITKRLMQKGFDGNLVTESLEVG